MQIPHCANCDIAIRWQPTVLNGRAYCCAGCGEGGPCECDYTRLPPVPIRFIRFELTIAVYRRCRATSVREILTTLQ